MALLGMEFDDASVVEGNSNTVNTTVTSGTITEINSISLSKGTWLIIAKCDWESNANGVRQISFSNAMNPPRHMGNTASGYSGGKETYQDLSVIDSFSTSLTVKLYGFQNSGLSLAAYSWIRAFKLN